MLISENHDLKIAGHIGSKKTLMNINKYYYWPKMSEDINLYVTTCIVCQTTKANNRKPYGLLFPHSIPLRRFATVSMDFIVALPKTKDTNYNSILVIVDKLTKYSWFIPTNTTIDAPGTALLYLKHIALLGFGLPTTIISDRDSKFTSTFWKALWSLLDTKLELPTAYHQQADGQSERMNRTLEQMLRAYTSRSQDNWDTLLMYAAFAYNSSVQASTRFSPIKLAFGQEPAMPATIETLSFTELGNVSAQQTIKSIKENVLIAKTNLQSAIDYQKYYYDLKHQHLTFKVNELVFVDTSDFTVDKGTPKLHDKFIGPCKIIKVINQLTYEIELPKPFARLHPAFHISKLKPYRDTTRFKDRIQRTRPGPSAHIDEQPAWEVEYINNKRTHHGKVQNEVKWKDYPEYENSWEPISNLKQAKEAIEKYEQTEKHKRK